MQGNALQEHTSALSSLFEVWPQSACSCPNTAQASPDCSHHTSTVCCAGYIAPEVIRGIMQPSGDPVKEGCEDPNHHYGPPCDLWSAGIVLYMLLSGERSGNRCSAGW